MSTTVAQLNMHHGVSLAGMRSDLSKVIAAGAEVISMNEVDRARGKLLRAYLATQGYGFIMVHDAPVAYKLSKFKMVAHNSRTLSHAKYVGNAGAGPSTAHAKQANWVALVDKQSGQRSVFTSAHFTASRTLPGRKQLWNQQVHGAADLEHDLRKKYGKDTNYFFMGDLNTSKYGSLAPLRNRGGLNTYRAPDKTQKHGYIDWIASNLRPGQRRVLKGLNSDHNAYIATFGKNTGGNQNNGNGNPPGGNGNPNGQPGSGGETGQNQTGGNGNGNNNGNGDNVPTSAFEYFSDLLESWGVPVGSDIERIIRKAVKDGITPDQIGLIIPDIQKTNSWNTRFPGWAARVKNGYSQVSVDEYLQLEDQYHQIMQQAGLPKGFYDDPSDFGNWIAHDVSPDEINSRVGMAVTAAKAIDPTARNLMARFYGLTPGDVASYFLDQKRALPVIERQYNAAGVASWAARSGLAVDDMKRFEGLVDSGVSIDQAAQGYGTVAALTNTVGRVGRVYGQSYNQTDAEGDVFFNDSEKRRQIMANESATFGGSSSGATGSAKRQSY